MVEETFYRGDRDATSREGAATLRREIAALASVRTAGPIVIAWCGGTSPDRLCRAFTDEFCALPDEVRQRVHFVLIDERRVPLDDPQSNYAGLSQWLFQPLLARAALTPSQVHPFPVSLTPHEAAEHYSDEIEALGGIDIVILGVGPDAHIAALFPHHELLSENELRFCYVADRPKPPREGFTASPALVSSSSVAFLLFYGEEKRDALRRFRECAPIEDAPVNLARRVRTRFVLTDLAE